MKKLRITAMLIAMAFTLSSCGTIRKMTEEMESSSAAEAEIPLYERNVHFDEGEAEVFYEGAPTTELHFSDPLIDRSYDDEYYIRYEEYEDYAVCAGTFGAINETEVEILAEYNGKPVTKIADEAFDTFGIGVRKGKPHTFKRIILPESIEEIGSEAFMYCTDLEEINLPDSLKIIGDNAFNWCEKLTELDIPDSVEYIGDEAFGLTPFGESLQQRQDEFVILGKVLYLNNGDRSADSITIPDGLTMLGGCTYSSMENLKEVTVPEGIKYIGLSAFCGCEKLEKVSLPKSLVRLEDSAFSHDYSLESIVLPENLEHIGKHCFERCEKLDNIEFNSKLWSFGSHPFEKSKWENDRYGLIVVNGVLICPTTSHKSYTVPDGVIAIADYAFNGTCADEIILPDSVEYIGEHAFFLCATIDINMPKNLKEIAYNSFECSGVTKAMLPDGMITIGKGAFQDCHSLRKASIPKGTVEIPQELFSGCRYLEELTVPNSVIYVGDAAIPSGNQVTIHGNKNIRF
ncbi:MAG: leucine-rich repeat domain-containing protein [Oscillospiraceae bacterium]|nr:leucine-rich repeat domain-containing protein [Oscillospiraceae bacterium]